MTEKLELATLAALVLRQKQKMALVLRQNQKIPATPTRLTTAAPLAILLQAERRARRSQRKTRRPAKTRSQRKTRRHAETRSQRRNKMQKGMLIRKQTKERKEKEKAAK